MGDIHYSESTNWKIRSRGQRVNWSICAACVIATDQRDGVESVQNMTVCGGLTEAEGDICDEDFPGASLNGRRPEDLKVPELKYWLECRRAPTKGKKADLVAR